MTPDRFERVIGSVEVAMSLPWVRVATVAVAFPAAVVSVSLGAIDPTALTSSGATATVTGMLAMVLVASLVHFRAENKRTDHNRDMSVIDARKEAEDARHQLAVERERMDLERRLMVSERERHEQAVGRWQDERSKLIAERDTLRSELDDLRRRR